MNKPFDRIVKAFADEAPRLFLHLLGIVPEHAVVTITPLRPETAPPVVLPDYVAVLSVESADPFTFHVEFQLILPADMGGRMARYGVGLALQYGRRVVSVLVLLCPVEGAAEIPEVGEFSIGETRVQHRFRVVKLWEIDAAPVLASQEARVLPWAMLLKLSDEQARQVGARLAEEGDEETVVRFLTLGSLRYHRVELEQMLGGTHMGLVEAILQGSSLVREVKEKAAAEARAEGEAKGRTGGQADEARRLLRKGLLAKYPGLETMPEIDAISAIETLESLLIDEVLASNGAARVEAAIRAAANRTEEG